MVAIYPDGNYDQSDVWGSATNDRVAWERSFTQGTDAQQKMAQAMITQSMATPDAEIRAKMTMLPPPAPSGLVNVQPTIDDIFQVGPKGIPASRKPTDFSGSEGGYTGTSQPSLPSY